MKDQFTVGGAGLLREVRAGQHHVSCWSDLGLEHLGAWGHGLHQVIISWPNEVDLVGVRVYDGLVVLHAGQSK